MSGVARFRCDPWWRFIVSGTMGWRSKGSGYLGRNVSLICPDAQGSVRLMQEFAQQLTPQHNLLTTSKLGAIPRIDTETGISPGFFDGRIAAGKLTSGRFFRSLPGWMGSPISTRRSVQSQWFCRMDSAHLREIQTEQCNPAGPCSCRFRQGMQPRGVSTGRIRPSEGERSLPESADSPRQSHN